MKSDRYQVWRDGLTTTPVLSRRYGVADMWSPQDDAGRPTRFMLQTDLAHRASEYAAELNRKRA